MWQSQNQRPKAPPVATSTTGKRRDRERRRLPVHIKRARAELKSVTSLGAAPIVAEARVVLNDMSIKGVGLFAPVELVPGTVVAITISEPTQFFIKGRVVWCQEHDATSHVLSKNAFSFRVGIEFLYENPSEQQAVKQYLEVLARDYLFSFGNSG